MAGAATAGGTPQARREAARRAAEALRRLEKLEGEERQSATDRLRDGAKAAARAGDMALSEALRDAALALESGDTQTMGEAAQALQNALNEPGDAQQGEALAKELENIQRALEGSEELARGTAVEGQAGGISPPPREWAEGLEAGAGAGVGHRDEETPGFAVSDEHRDAKRFNEARPAPDDRDYKALYEAFLLNDGDRVVTRVKGVQNDSGRVDTINGGRQTPQNEKASRTIRQLPVQYTRDIDRAIGQETIPPVHRDAVRQYFER